MAMVASGPISLAGTATSGGLNQSIEVELGGNGSTIISFNDSNVRTLLGVPSGAISMNQAYSKNTYGPFIASSTGYSGSGSSAAGPGQTIHVFWSGSATISVTSGGPTSGSFSYNWFYESGDNTILIDNVGIQSPTWNGSFFVPQASDDSDTAVWGCTVTDLVSGYSYTAHGIVLTYAYTNNTG